MSEHVRCELSLLKGRGRYLLFKRSCLLRIIWVEIISVKYYFILGNPSGCSAFTFFGHASVFEHRTKSSHVLAKPLYLKGLQSIRMYCKSDDAVNLSFIRTLRELPGYCRLRCLKLTCFICEI